MTHSMHFLVATMVLMTFLTPTCLAQCKGTLNTLPVFKGEPKLVRSVPTGKLFHVGPEDPPIHVLHVYGTPYEMGLAHGQLLKDEIQDVVPKVFDYLTETIAEYIDFLPEEIRRILEIYGVKAALQATYYLVKPYTPESYWEEIQGIADGAGMTFDEMVQMTMLPELTQASCSMFGAWGPALADPNNPLIQLRALDWAVDGPFQNTPLVMVYHPEKDNGHDFAIVSFAGFVGGLTGYSSQRVGISEKFWGGYEGYLSRQGYPFHFLMRDILQYDKDIFSAIERMKRVERTCAIFLGVGDPVNKFRAALYNFDNVTVWTDDTQPDYPNHPRKKALIYIDKRFQPSQDSCMGELVNEYHGNITIETTIAMMSRMQSGNTHAAIYDFGENTMIVGFATPAEQYPQMNAYDRAFTELNMDKLFSEERP